MRQPRPPLISVPLISILLWLSFSVAAGAAALRFAWLSDLHIGSATAAEDLKAAVRDINSMHGLGFVVVSGDITEYGSLQQLRLAKEILDGLTVPYHIIPGNHDTKWSESGGTDFPRLWKADRFVLDAGGFRFVGLHQGPLMRMGDGHWAPQDVRWLEKVLKQSDARALPVIFITHYPINNSIANWFVVLDKLKAHGTGIVLCGHGHSNRKLSFEGLPGVMGRSNLRGRAAQGGFNLVELEGESITFSERVTGVETRPPWHSVSLTPQREQASRQAAPDFSLNQEFPSVRERWIWESGYTITSPALARSDSCLVGDTSGAVTSLALKSGQPRWSFKTAGPICAAPAGSGNLAVVASTDGCVYALDAESGRQVWRYKTRRALVASPLVAGGVVYVGSSEGKFRALDLKSGKLRWQFSGIGGFVEARPSMYDGNLFFGAWDQHLYAMDAVSGQVAWTWTGDRPGTLYSPAACWPVGAAGKVFVVAPDRQMTAIDARSGTHIWRSGKTAVRETIGLSEDQSRVFVRAMSNSISAFSTAARGVQKEWELDAGFGYDINSAMLVEKEGVLFYGTKNGLLLAVDSRTGKLKWQRKLGVALLNTVTPLSAREVLVTDFDGRVMLVEENL
jgi:outer membrane protein assembly factor BamB/predicted phosphodiesterase